MWIPARFNCLVEQGKEKLRLFEVVFKTTLTQTNRKKFNALSESEGYPADILFCTYNDEKVLHKLTGNSCEHTRGEKLFRPEI